MSVPKFKREDNHLRLIDDITVFTISVMKDFKVIISLNINDKHKKDIFTKYRDLLFNQTNELLIIVARISSLYPKTIEDFIQKREWLNDAIGDIQGLVVSFNMLITIYPKACKRFVKYGKQLDTFTNQLKAIKKYNDKEKKKVSS